MEFLFLTLFQKKIIQSTTISPDVGKFMHSLFFKFWAFEIETTYHIHLRFDTHFHLFYMCRVIYMLHIIYRAH